MDANLQQHLPLIAVAMSAAALFFSLVAAFPGLKGVLSAVRDGVLWFALALVAGGVGFVVWQQLQKQAGGPATASLESATLTSATRLDSSSLSASNARQAAPADPRAAVSP